MPHAQSSGFGTGLTCGGRQSNLCLQQTKPPVTAPACAGAAPDVFAAEAQVLDTRHEGTGHRFQASVLAGTSMFLVPSLRAPSPGAQLESGGCACRRTWPTVSVVGRRSKVSRLSLVLVFLALSRRRLASLSRSG